MRCISHSGRRIIGAPCAGITDGATVRDILAHPGEPPWGGAITLTLDNTNDCR